MRRLFPGQLLLLANGDPAVNGSYKVYDDLTAGNEITDLKASDGVSDLPRNGAFFVADAQGNAPHTRGPDTGSGANETVALFIDSGAGIRYAWLAVDKLEEMALGGAFTNQAQTWTAQQTFSQAPVVPDGSFTTAKVAGLAAAIAGQTAGLDKAAVNDMITAGPGITKTYNATTGIITISSGAAVPTLATMPAGYVHTMTYAVAAAAASRAAAITASQGGSTLGSTRTDIIVRIAGGTLADTDPVWMLNDDFRDIYAAA